MKNTALLFLICSFGLSAMAQEENAPLELGRPSATPIKIKRTPPPPPPDLEPPPQQQPKKKLKLVKKKKTKPDTVAAPLPVEPVTAPTNVGTKPEPLPQVPISPAAPPAVKPVTTPTAPVVQKPVPQAPGPSAQPQNKKVAVTSDQSVAVKAEASSLRQRSLLNFRFANIWAIRNRTNTGSFIVGWDPVIFPWKRFNFGTTLGITQFQSESVAGRSADNFFVYEYGLSSSYYLSRVFLPELVIGGQTWAEDGASTSSLMIALNANFLFKRRQFKFVDRAYFGMGSLQVSGGSTNIFRAGIGLRF